MTSARFPIGVAQTASGTSHRTPSSASNATSAAPIRPALVAELGLDDPQCLVGGLNRLGSRGAPRRPEHEVAGSGAEAAADDHDVGVEDVGERPDRGPEQPPDLGQRLDRPASPARPARRATGASAAGPKSSPAARSAARPDA